MERSRILVSAAACFLAAAAGCVPSAGGEGSESHFVCRSQADCDPLGPAYICEDRVCTKAGGAPEAGVADAPVPQRLQAGVCFGERTRCDPVSFEELAGGPTVEACDPTPSDPVVVDGGVSMETSVTWLNPNWLVDLETVSCPAPGCLQQVQELLPGANGELWISANVWTPHAEDLLGTEVVGDSLSRLGSDGQSLGAPAVTFRSRLSDASFSVRGMELGSDGDLFRAGASPSFDSIELQQYDEAGNRVAAFTTADSISSAMVAWGAGWVRCRPVSLSVRGRTKRDQRRALRRDRNLAVESNRDRLHFRRAGCAGLVRWWPARRRRCER